MVEAMNSDSEEERALQASDEDVLRDEENTEDLLDKARPKAAGLPSLFSQAASRDPNLPRPAKSNRRELRRQRRRDKRSRKRLSKGHNDDETSLMYEMEGGERASSEDSISTASEDLILSEKAPQRSRRKKLLHFTIIPAALSLLLCLLIYGAYVMSRKTKATPAAAKVLRSNGTSLFAPTTILISLDGFRADFLDRGLTPTLSRFVKEGVSPKHLLPSFPTVTFPNHWTLVTGLYPESHGVVGNSFWDPEMEKEFWYTDPARSMQTEWWTSTGAEPLWSTSELQGVRAAVHMWPGSEAGVLPQATYVDKYNGSEALPRKVDRVLGLLDRPSEYDTSGLINDEARPHFIAYYVPNVDSHGHLYGPNSTEIRQTITNVDTMLQNLFDGLEQRNLTKIVNIVVVSDHGMATTSVDRLVQLDDLLDVDDIEHTDGWPLYGLRPKSGVDITALYEKLKTATATNTHLEVYLRENMPERWHFSASDRIAPLWIIPEAGWAIVTKEKFDVAAAKEAGTPYKPFGLHGYDHEHPLMRAIFVARGPAFPHKPNSRLEIFQNTEIYNIVCDSLGVDPRPNNGTLRLPLKPVGLHSDVSSADDAEKEPAPIVDLPASPSSPTSTPPSTVAASSSPSSPSSTSEAQNIEEHKSWNVWDALAAARKKLKDYLAKISSWFHNGGGKQSGEKADPAQQD